MKCVFTISLYLSEVRHEFRRCSYVAVFYGRGTKGSSLSCKGWIIRRYFLKMSLECTL